MIITRLLTSFWQYWFSCCYALDTWDRRDPTKTQQTQILKQTPGAQSYLLSAIVPNERTSVLEYANTTVRHVLHARDCSPSSTSLFKSKLSKPRFFTPLAGAILLFFSKEPPLGTGHYLWPGGQRKKLGGSENILTCGEWASKINWEAQSGRRNISFPKKS